MPDESYHVVRVSRLIPVSEEVQEIILTTCCSAPSTLIENGGLFASSVAVAVFGAFPNTTGGDTSGNPQDERLIPDPAYRELAPCPCDLTYLSCDTNCCCDPECSEETKSAFSVCISGVVGGQGHGVDLRRCGSEHFPKTDWFPMLCVVSEFNALLGQYYDVRPKLSNLGLLKTVLTEIQSTRLYSYRKTELRFDKPEAQHGYDLGTDVFFVDRDNISHKLPLPQNDYSGLCLDDSPVQFLRNSKANCPRKVTWETCSGSAVFSARMFAIPSSLSSPAYLQSHAMSASVRSELNVLRRVNIDVNYHCAGINHSGYFYDLNPDVGQQRSSTDLLSGLGDIDCYGLCNPDSDSSTCLRFNADITVEALPPLPSRCVNDTGFSMPDEPFFNTVTEVCENAVLDVRYRLHWSGQSITSFSADVVMGDVPQGIFTQKFSADFMHDARLQPNNSDLSLGLKRSFDRSGSPGYDWGKPVVSGCRENESASVNTKQEVQLAVFYPGVDTLCKNSRRRPLTFGEDLSSQCSLYLTVGQLSNCSLLRRAVLNYLNILMPANVIGRFGYNLPYVSDTWIPILRNYPESSSKALTPVTSSPGSQGTTQDSQHTNESTIIRPLDWLTGFCPNLATGVHLEILYAETGRNKNYPLREIIGASVRYSISDWNMACVVPFIAMCEVDSAIPQQFFIASSVRYIGVSQASTQPNILFYEIHKKETCASDSCYRFFHDFDTSVCHYDTCWQELLYPITKAYAGYEDLAYTRAVSLVFVLFTVGFLFAIKPWK